MSSTGERLLRSDARRNRARLIEVAAAAFRDEGLDVGVDEIARRAEVGVATLYRHFPAKTDLIVAVVGGVLADLEHAAREALEGDSVLAVFLGGAMRVQCQNRGFLQALAQQDLPTGTREELGRRAVTIFEPVVAAAKQAGTFRDELDAIDLLVIVRMLGVVSAAPNGRSSELYLATLLRGLSP